MRENLRREGRSPFILMLAGATCMLCSGCAARDPDVSKESHAQKSQHGSGTGSEHIKADSPAGRWLLRAPPDPGLYRGQPDYAQDYARWVVEGRQIPQVEEALLRALAAEARPEQRQGLVMVLGPVATGRSVPVLVTILQNEEEALGVRDWAATALGTIRDARGLEPLCAAAEGTDPDLRMAACCALGKFDAPRAEEVLTEALRDEIVGVRSTAQGALERIQERRWAKAKQEEQQRP